MTSETIYQIVRKLVGDIYPTGEHSVDADRKKNMEKLIDVFMRLYNDVICGAAYHNNPCQSEKEIGKICHDCLNIINTGENDS